MAGPPAPHHAAIGQLLSRTVAEVVAAHATLDDVTVDYCWRVAQDADADDDADVQGLAELIRDMLLAPLRSPPPELPLAAVREWLKGLRGVGDGGKAEAAGELAFAASASASPSMMPTLAAAKPLLNAAAAVFVPGGAPVAGQHAAIVTASGPHPELTHPELTDHFTRQHDRYDMWPAGDGTAVDDAAHWAQHAQHGALPWDEAGAPVSMAAPGGWAMGDSGQAGGPQQPHQLLGLMFPSYNAAMLQQLLATFRGDVAATVDELLRLEGGGPGAIPAHNSAPDSAGSERSIVAAAARSGPDVGPRATAPKVGAAAAALDDAFPSLATAAAARDAKGGGGQPTRTAGAAAAAAGSWATVAARAVATSPTVHPSPYASAKPASATRPAHVDRRAGAQCAGSGSRSGGHGWEGVPRVATGDQLRAQYAEARSEARDWARARNLCFQQATLAYLSGNKALARELSMKGRAYADRMWAAHEEAADALMDERRAVRRSQVPGGPVMLDLHGLHVREALGVLQAQAEEAGGQVLHVVVGVGKHAAVAAAQPRLLTAVTQALRDWGWRFRQLQPGLLEVTVPNR